MKTDDRIGTIGIPIDPEKVKGIVFTNQLDSPSTIVPPDEETVIMAQHLIEFLREEVKIGRLTNRLAPLQSGIGSVANAVLHGMLDSEFEDLEVYSEVLQDAVLILWMLEKSILLLVVLSRFLKRKCNKYFLTLKNIVTN